MTVSELSHQPLRAQLVPHSHRYTHCRKSGGVGRYDRGGSKALSGVVGHPARDVLKASIGARVKERLKFRRCETLVGRSRLLIGGLVRHVVQGVFGNSGRRATAGGSNDHIEC